jgi:hypothetical protein
MLYLENNTTFSGADIRAYIYRSVDDLVGKYKPDSDKVSQPETSRDLDFDELNDAQDSILSVFDQDDPSSKSFIKVNPKYIDIVKKQSDKTAINLRKEYERSKMSSSKGGNERLKKANQNSPIQELGSLYSFTYSSFREKMAVRTLGRVSAKAYTRGQRTIAGSMNFAVFQSHELMDFLRTPVQDNIVLLDQLPKFNIMLIMINEYGGASIFHLFGVTISTESQQMSVEDLALINSVSFYAEDIVTVENVGNLFDTSLAMLHPAAVGAKSLAFVNRDGRTTFSDLLNNNEGSNAKISNLINRSRGLF